jgi:replicative DNA helicase
MIINMALDNNPVLFFTLEMPPRETTIRFMKMVKSKEVVDRDHEVVNFTEQLPLLPIYYYHGTNVTLPILDKAIEKGKKIGIKCVVIDHLHFFAKGNDNQASEIGNITREIKLMARKYEIPIILICHIRKTGSPGRTPQLEDLKDSSGIAQDADMVLMAWRDMEKNSPEMKIKVRKNRRRGALFGYKFDMDANGYLQEGGFSEEDDRI